MSFELDELRFSLLFASQVVFLLEVAWLALTRLYICS